MTNRKRKNVQLELQKFMSLPLSVVTEICRFLEPINLIYLAWSCKSLRRLFMTVQAKPHWDAARTLQGMPDWHGVANPQAAAFMFLKECQGGGCDKDGKLEFFHLCRRYCRECARKNLWDWKDVLGAFPQLPSGLLCRLPFTKYWTPEGTQGSESCRYYLKQDVMKLWRFVEPRPHQTASDIAALHKQLVPSQRARKLATANVDSWYHQTRRASRQTVAERWGKIQSILIKRFEWKPVRYKKLSPDLKTMVDYFLNVPELTDQVWNVERDRLILILAQDSKVSRPVTYRPFSLLTSE